MRKLLLLAVVVIGVYLGYCYYTQGDRQGNMPIIVQAQSRTHTSPHTTTQGRIQRIAPRVNQLDPTQYRSQQDYSTWWPSACSAAAMTAVINSYGHQYTLGDILKVEASLGEITPEVGLVEPQGIARTVAVFGFSTRYLHQNTLQETLRQLLNIANAGHPVIVSFPPDTYEGGHIFVVDGSGTYVNSSTGKMEVHIMITDSARPNWRFMPIENFMTYWRGFAVEVTPKGTQQS